MLEKQEIEDIKEATAEAGQDEEHYIELNEEARVGLALYLKVMNGGKVTKEGTLVPQLNIHQLSRVAEVNEKMVSKCFDRLRGKGFINNNDKGELYIPELSEFEAWLKLEGAVID